MDAQNIDALNRSCDCLRTSAPIIEGWSSNSQPFAANAVLLAEDQLRSMERFARSFHALVSRVGYRSLIAERLRVEGLLARGENLPEPDRLGHGLCVAYDFHVGSQGPKLIEINTNAGGGFLLSELLHAARSAADHCGDARLADYQAVAPDLVDTVLAEWRAHGRTGTPESLVIVDEHPDRQFLHADMQLAARWLRVRGIDVQIVDPLCLSFQNGELLCDGSAVDFVYNRLTDFALNDESSRPVRDAWCTDAAVVSPNPWHYALMADKRNLHLLSDVGVLRRVGVPRPSDFNVVPLTRLVKKEDADELWDTRRRWVFKPVCGFGSRGVYRGDKVTRRVFADILNGEYVAQELVAAPQRLVRAGGASQLLKYELRLFAYAGEPVLLGARIYQGQVTNFRTPGGGFAPVYVW